MSALLSLLLLMADPSAPTIAPAAPAEMKSDKQAEKKICRTEPAESGSRLKNRICKTAAEWDNRKQGVTAGDLKTLGAR